jgi:hypothetical protein
MVPDVIQPFMNIWLELLFLLKTCRSKEEEEGNEKDLQFQVTKLEERAV